MKRIEGWSLLAITQQEIPKDMSPSAGSLEVRRIAVGSCIGSSRKLFGLNRLHDSALRPSGRFARSVRKA